MGIVIVGIMRPFGVARANGGKFICDKVTAYKLTPRSV